MNPFACRIALRPRTPFESLDMALRVLRADAGPLARMALTTLLPAAVVLGAFVAAQPSRLVLRVGFAMVVLLAPLLQVPFTALVAQRLFDATVRPRDVRLGSARWRAYTLICVSTAMSALIGVLTLASMWPVAHAVTLWVVEAAVLERLPLRRALSRSLALATQGFVTSIAGAFVSAILLGWVVLVTELLAQGLVGFVLQLGQPFGAMTDGDVTPWMFLGVLLAQPCIALYRVILYVDLRTAVEGWDVQVAMMAAAEDA